MSCFKEYDIRGKIGEELTENKMYVIGNVTAKTLGAAVICVGCDARETSLAFKNSLIRGIADAGCVVLDLGLIGTEEMYYATNFYSTSAGIIVTASHNPIEYNGVKIVKHNAVPLSSDEFKTIERLVNLGNVAVTSTSRRVNEVDAKDSYASYVSTLVDGSKIKGLKLVVNAGNGIAGPAFDKIEENLSMDGADMTVVKLNHNPDSSFPCGIPNPMIAENRTQTIEEVIKHGADLGIAWDGDFDRCFLFDETGEFVDGYYLVGLLAEAFLKKNANEKIIYDPRVYWNTEEVINDNGGNGIKCKTGHVHLKYKMRLEDAVYGGEMSGHHYFRDFFFCDSGMIPWLLVTELMCETGKPLSEMVAEMKIKYPSSGEINFDVDMDKVAPLLVANYSSDAIDVDAIDGIEYVFNDWRFNIRPSSTEHMVRMNVETRGDVDLLERKVSELTELLS